MVVYCIIVCVVLYWTVL